METKKRRRGRPETPDYRKRTHRYAKIEDVFNEILGEMKNKKDRELVEKALEKLRA